MVCLLPLRRELFGAPDAPYVAVHLRLGGFDGEWRDIQRFDPFKVRHLPGTHGKQPWKQAKAKPVLRCCQQGGVKRILHLT